jgi:hypothetical protein
MVVGNYNSLFHKTFKAVSERFQSVFRAKKSTTRSPTRLELKQGRFTLLFIEQKTSRYDAALFFQIFSLAFSRKKDALQTKKTPRALLAQGV